MIGEWTPLGLSEAEERDYAVLRSDLTDGAKAAVIGWLLNLLVTSSTGNFASAATCRSIQVATDVWLNVPGAESLVHREDVAAALGRTTDMQLLRVVDYVLSNLRGENLKSRSGTLETVLKAARSKWTAGVRMGRPGLAERVPEGVQDFAESVAAGSQGAGRILARAWAAIHGLEPKASATYSDAVVAVEIAAIAVVQPRHNGATLGTVIGQMEADGDWRLPLREHGKAPAPELVISMLRTLWFGHRDRHGKVDYSSVTVDEARASVGLAAVLIDWFDSGALSRRIGAET